MLAKNLLIATAALLLIACKQELPQEIESKPEYGTIQSVQTMDEKQLIYINGEDPSTKRWGIATSYYVTVDGDKYQVAWDQVEKFKALKVGDKVNLHPSDYIACIGESDLKPRCVRLMKIYRSERRIDPIQVIQ